jgi:preprotein translocase subunit SecE
MLRFDHGLAATGRVAGSSRRSVRHGDCVMAKSSPFEFIQQVRAEASKVTWPTRKETLVTTAMVFVMVVIASVFFLFADMIIRWGVGLVLGVGR